MIIYSVTYAIEDQLEHEWLEFMKNAFIPNVMDTGYFEDYTFTRVLAQEGTDTAYNIQYSCFNHEKLNLFIANVQNNLDALMHQKYNGRFASFFTKLEKID